MLLPGIGSTRTPLMVRLWIATLAVVVLGIWAVFF